jgi:hypothetical protein
MSRPEDPEDHDDWSVPAQWPIAPRVLGAVDWAG